MRILSEVNKNIGYFYRLIGKHKKAEYSARKAILYNGNASAWRLLGLELSDKANVIPPNTVLEQEAEKAFNMAHKLAPSSYYILLNLCCYLAYLGKSKEAMEIVNSYKAVNKIKAQKLKSIINSFKKGSTRGLDEEKISCDCEDDIPCEINLIIALADEYIKSEDFEKADNVLKNGLETINDNNGENIIKKKLVSLRRVLSKN